mgnify:FL=1
MTFYFIRHGESGENTGSTRDNDSILTAQGAQQAEQTASWLASDTENNPLPLMVYASPARRALATAVAIAGRCEAPLVVDPELCEYGMLYDAPGLTGRELASAHAEIRLPEGMSEDVGWASGWIGESKPELIARVQRVLERLLAAHPPGAGPVALVSHAHFTGFLLGRMFGIPEQLLSTNRLRLSNCGVSRVDVTPSYRQMHYANHTTHLSARCRVSPVPDPE